MLMRPIKQVKSGIIVVTMGPEQFFVQSDKASRLSLPATKYGPLVRGTGCSSHGGVTLLAGQVFNEDQSTWQTVIYSSRDGKVWTQSFMSPGGPVQYRGGALVWYKNAFHFSFTWQSVFGGDGNDLTEYEMSSKNGFSWSGPSAVSSVPPTAEDGGYRSPFPGKYCGQHNCVDAWGQNVPDGFMIQGEKFHDFVRPQAPPPFRYSTGYPDIFTTDFRSSTVIETGRDGGIETTSAPFSVYCVSEGIAGGFGSTSGTLGFAQASPEGDVSWKTIDLGDVASVISISPIGG